MTIVSMQATARASVTFSHGKCLLRIIKGCIIYRKMALKSAI